jgi:hypothetical protein
MSSKITPDEYDYLSKQNATNLLKNAKLLDARYIDLPRGMRLYMLTISYSSSTVNKITLRYFLRPNTRLFTLSREVYNRDIIFNSVSPYPWQETREKMYEYQREYGLINDIERYSYTKTGIKSS